MDVKIRILSYDAASRSCVVHAYTDAYPQGGRWNVNIYPDPMPTGQALIDYLIKASCGNGDWLELMSKCAQQPADMNPVEQLIGQELVGTVMTRTEKELAGMTASPLTTIERTLLEVPETTVESF